MAYFDALFYKLHCKGVDNFFGLRQFKFELAVIKFCRSYRASSLETKKWFGWSERIELPNFVGIVDFRF